MTTALLDTSPDQGYGYNGCEGFVVFTPSASATQTLVHNFGVVSVTRSGAGTYQVNLSEKFPAGFIASVGFVTADTAYHEVSKTAVSGSAGTINITHRTCTYATIVSAGPALADTGLTAITVRFRAVRG